MCADCRCSSQAQPLADSDFVERAQEAFYEGKMRKEIADYEAQMASNPLAGCGAAHFDENKLPYHLLAPELLDSVCEVLAYGRQKYAERNWEKGMAWSKLFASTMRHLWAWWRRESYDRESGLNHLWHAATNIMFLIAYTARNIGTDDRR